MGKRRINIKHRVITPTPKKKDGTHRNTWKHMERVVATFFGTRRNPLSGGNSGHSRSDSLHPEIFIESKFRAKLPVWDLFYETADLAKLEKKIPVVALKKKGQKGFLIVCEMKDLCKLAELKQIKDGESNGKERD